MLINSINWNEEENDDVIHFFKCILEFTFIHIIFLSRSFNYLTTQNWFQEKFTSLKSSICGHFSNIQTSLTSTFIKL